VTDPPLAIIMAAGRGTRMRSHRAKVLHPICGRPMLSWVIAAARGAGAERIICVSRPGDRVSAALPDGVEAAEQRDGEGTAAAVMAARAEIEGHGSTVLTLSGDHPMLTAETIAELVDTHRRAGAAATLLTTASLDPTGYGRVVRTRDGSVERIVETKDTEGVSPNELAIREVNLGTYAFEAPALLDALDSAPEERGERYLTAVFTRLHERGHPIAAHPIADAEAALGVNTRVGLMEAEAIARRRIAERHALNGVTLHAPETIAIDAEVEIAADTEIHPGSVLRGETRIGESCTIGPHTTILDSRLADEVTALRSHLVECDVARKATIGPFSYLRPGTEVGEGAKVGAFVETKNAQLGEGAKVPHLSYVGDAEVGAGTNLGASTITANYDGERKHRTVIGADVHTAVHTSLVAPVRVGDGAYTGAGSVITDDVPDGALGIARPRQKNLEGYAAKRAQRKP
jgi:bifunctional UDP-N-acetylglucosamine pyrophosphorylase/glucosamine-1-phosphate N-acetyltransferase